MRSMAVAAAPEQHAHADDVNGHIDPQNMWNMGGLRKQMPYTFYAFLIGGASLAGLPFLTAGFWSKDEILGEAFHLWQEGEMGGTVPFIVLVLLTVTAVLTAFYTGRQLGLTFFGTARTEEATHAHESPPAMLIPLGVLSLFAIIAGFVNIPGGVIPGSEGFHGLGHLLEEVHVAAIGEGYHALPFNWFLALLTGGLGTLAFVGGIALYAGRTRDPLRYLGPLWWAMERKWFVDEIYSFLIIRPAVATASLLSRVDGDWLIDPIVNGVGKVGRMGSNANAWFDRNIVDGSVNFLALITDETSKALRLIQTGRVQNYLVVLLAGLLALAGIYFR